MPSDVILQPRFGVDSPYLADYFGLWMIYDQAFLSLVERVQGADLHVHMQSPTVQQAVADRDNRNYPVTRDGIAQIAIRGPIMKSVPSMAEGTSSVRVRQQLRAAARDPEVLGAMLVMDTPGGTAKGNEDLANEVSSFAAKKPIFAFVEDLTASAGISVSSQATKRFANTETAIYGAMGTYAVLQDLSGAAEKLGVKVHVIKAGDFKGLGEPGTEITEEQISEIQRIVDRVNNAYLGLIAKGLGRSVEAIRSLADGRAIMASDAVKQGLIDGIQTYEQTYAQLVEAVSGSATSPATSRRNSTMAEKTPATLAELKATFPNSTAEWRESQLEAEASLSEAAVSYAQHVEAEAAAEREKHAKELEEAKNATTETDSSSSLGHTPLTQTNAGGNEQGDTGDPVQDFDAAVRARLPKHRTATFEERQAAIGYVAHSNPELHRAYLAATNSDSPKVKRMLAEKYEEAST